VLHPNRGEPARLDKLLRCGALDEVAVAPIDAPGDLAHQLPGLGRAEEVRLAVERVEERVQPRRDVPAALPPPIFVTPCFCGTASAIGGQC